MIDRIVVSRWILICALGVASCDGVGDGARMSAKPAESPVDTGAEQARTGLLARDLAFGNTVAERGLAEAYRLFLAEDAVQLPDGDWPLRGRDAIYEQILAATQGSEDSNFALSWKPEAAEVSAAGDLGYTWGTYWLELVDEDGDPAVVEGNYVNVWRKSAGGVWEVIVDISNQIAVDYGATAINDSNAPVANPDIE